MQSINLFSYTKNIDLHAVSASEAVVSFMHYDRLMRLRRFHLTRFQLETEEVSDAEAHVASMISKTLDILNPNNEGYRLHTLVMPKPAKNTEVFLVAVRPLFSTGEKNKVSRIQKKTGVPLVSLDKAVVWELHVKSIGKTREELQDDLQHILVDTTSRERGILCNSLFEKAEFLDVQTHYAASN